MWTISRSHPGGGWLTVAFVAVFLAALLVLPAGATIAGLLYSDDFSTARYLTDSYERSQDCGTIIPPHGPPPWPPCLSLGRCAYIGTGLHFSYTDPDRPLPYLRYRFALDQPLSREASAAVEIRWCGPTDVCSCWFSISIAPTRWPEAEPDTLNGPGGTVRKLLPAGADSIYVALRAHDSTVNFWSLSLDMDTPVERSTWGRIKTTYGAK